MALPGLWGVSVPSRLQPTAVDVQRSAQAGVDASGMPVEAWTTVYAAVPCAVDLHAAGAGAEWEQPGMDMTGYAYFGTPVGNPPALPDLRKGDRLLWGEWWPGGPARYLDVVEYLDEMEAGVVGVCTVRARRPG